jgi:hypothetical protein
MVCLWLRAKDIDFHTHQIVVREGKGNTERVTIVPARVKALLSVHLERMRVLQRAMKEAVWQAGLAKPAPVTPCFCDALTGRWLRHPHDSKNYWDIEP